MAATTNPTRSDVAHLLRRAGFGARPDEIDRAVKSGYRSTVESLLAGLSARDPGGDAIAVPALSNPGATSGQPTARQRAAQQAEILALQRWWLDRMIATSTPLREKLTLLWHGHFATSYQKVRIAEFMYRQNQLFRAHGGGSFVALTQAVAKDPAMMRWLDTETNVAGHPNENFARELMELFTLGIGNYSERDVTEAARAFTGWSVVPATGEFVLRGRRHDNSPKTFLGQTGNFDGTDIIAIVTRQPASPRFVVAKLWSHLAYPIDPADPLVAPLAAAFARDVDITKLLRAIFLHPLFTSATAKAGLVKQPIEWAVGLARAFGLTADLKPVMPGTGTSTGTSASPAAPAGAPAAGAPTPGAPTPAAPAASAAASSGRPALSAVLNLLGQEPFNPPSVGGWPQNTYWLNTATSLARLQAGTVLAKTADLAWLAGLPVSQRPNALAHHLSIDGWGQTSAAALNHVASSPAALVALAVTAPEYVLN